VIALPGALVSAAAPVYAARVRLLPLAIVPLVLCACAAGNARPPSGDERRAIVAAIGRDWQSFASELAVLQDQNRDSVPESVPYLELLPHVAAVRVSGSGSHVASAAVDLRGPSGRVRLPQAIVLLVRVGNGWYWALGGKTAFAGGCDPATAKAVRDLVCPSPWTALGLPASRAPRLSAVVSVPVGSGDVHTLDWGSVPVPGAACGTSGPVRVHGGEALVRSAIEPWWPVVQVVTQRPVFADLDGDGSDEAIVRVVCSNAGGSADGQLGFADVVYRMTGRTLRSVAVLAPRQPLTLSAGHVPLLGPIDAGPGRIVENEAWYGLHDATCCPSGRARTTWRYVNGKVTPTTVVVRAPTPG
jgi:hypothetical protein